MSERNQWILDINATVLAFERKLAAVQKVEKSWLLRNQMWFRFVYVSFECQVLVALLVGCNFCFMLSQSQAQPEEGPPTSYGYIEDFFTIIFAMELTWNMAAFWFTPFITDPWNWFDMVRIITSPAILSQIHTDSQTCFIAPSKLFTLHPVAFCH